MSNRKINGITNINANTTTKSTVESSVTTNNFVTMYMYSVVTNSSIKSSFIYSQYINLIIGKNTLSLSTCFTKLIKFNDGNLKPLLLGNIRLSLFKLYYKEDQLQANVCKCIALRSCFKLKDKLP